MRVAKLKELAEMAAKLLETASSHRARTAITRFTKSGDFVRG
jgi:hypothetical protein